MLSPECLQELQERWLPNVSDSGLERLIDLLQKGSRLLLSGSFTRTNAMGCLATQAGWHHPQTCGLHHDAGVMWLEDVVGLHPAQSQVIREWDADGASNFESRQELLGQFRAEQARRRTAGPNRIKDLQGAHL